MAVIVNRALFANLFQFEAAGFSKLQLDLTINNFRIFFYQSLLSLYVALWRFIEPCFTTINSAFYLFNFQPSDQIIFLKHTFRLHQETSLPDHHTRQSDHKPDQTTTYEYHNRPSSRPDHPIRPSDHTTTANPDHQFRSPHQTTGHHPWLLSFQSAQHTQPLEMVQVRCILYGLGRGWYIELWMNLAKHTFHTRSAGSFRTLFRLKLIVVRLASGFPGLVRASPSLFLKMGSFAGVRSAIRFRLLAIGSAFWIRFDI